MTKGPTCYSAYMCDGCEFLIESIHLYCNDPYIKKLGIDNALGTRVTPSWCPYLNVRINK